MIKHNAKGKEFGVLLMAYGAAASLDEIPAYLQDIRGGRPPPLELVAAIRKRYEIMGGKSPLLGIARAQAQALESMLKKSGFGCKVYIGMRHSPPAIKTAVDLISGAGHQLVVAIPLTPYQSNMSTGAYFRKYQESIEAVGGKWKTIRIESWCRKTAFIEGCAQKVKEGMEHFEGGPFRVLFTAHSLPEHILKEGDPYPTELRLTVEAVANRVGLDRWEFAYQSRGQTQEPWLGPDAGETIERLAREGCRNLLVVPIGFICDHMETLYDDDVLYKGQAEQLGMRFERARALNDSPLLIQALTDSVSEALQRTTVAL